MRLITPFRGVLALCLSLALGTQAAAQSNCITLTPSVPTPWMAGAPLDFTVSGNPGDFVAVIISDTLAPTVLPFATLDVEINATTMINFMGQIGPSGSTTFPCPSTCGLGLTMEPLYAQAVTFTLAPFILNCKSTVLVAEFVTSTCGMPCAIAAPLDPTYGVLTRYNAFVMDKGVGEDYFFQNDGVFLEHTDGTATLTGTIVSLSDPTACWTVNMSYSGRESRGGNSGVFPPAGAPKKLLAPSAYVENGGPIDPMDWRYYMTTSGTLTGCGKFAGAVVSTTGRGGPFQVGVGANGKNLNFGASGWIDFTTVQQPTTGSLPATFVGDNNVDLTNCP